MINQQIVEEIVIEVVRKMELRAQKEKPPLLVISQSTKKNKQQIEELKRHWHVVEMLSSDSEIPTATKYAVILDANQDLIVKGAIGITDTPESLLFSKLMLAGFQVDFVADNSLSILLRVAGNKQVNENYLAQLIDYQTKLRDFGVHLYSLAAILPKEVNEMSISSTIKEPIYFADKVLTKNVVETWKNDRIRVHPNTIITPLARDVAREMGITICTDES